MPKSQTTADPERDGVELVPADRIVTDRLFDLRDYFAGQALCGLLAAGWSPTHTELVAERAVALADAMLAARQRKGG